MKFDLYIIGSGTMAEKFYRKAVEMETLSIQGMVIRREAKKHFFSNLNEELLIYSDLDELCSIEDLIGAVVIVATPPNTHFEICNRLLEKGCHILCEKPLGITLNEAKTLAKKAVFTGVYNGCCESRLFNYQPIILAREYIESGRLGKIYYVEQKGISTLNRPGIEYQPHSRWYLDKKKAGGGPFLDWGVYDIAILEKICNGIDDIYLKHAFKKKLLVPHNESIAHENLVEEHGIAVSEMKTGDGDHITYVHERGCVCHGSSRLEMRICGEKGGIEMNWFILEPYFKYYSFDEEFGLKRVEHTINQNYEFDTYPLVNFVDAILKNKKPDVDFTDAARHIEYIDAIYSHFNFQQS